MTIHQVLWHLPVVLSTELMNQLRDGTRVTKVNVLARIGLRRGSCIKVFNWIQWMGGVKF